VSISGSFSVTRSKTWPMEGDVPIFKLFPYAAEADTEDVVDDAEMR